MQAKKTSESQATNFILDMQAKKTSELQATNFIFDMQANKSVQFSGTFGKLEPNIDLEIDISRMDCQITCLVLVLNFKQNSCGDISKFIMLALLVAFFEIFSFLL